MILYHATPQSVSVINKTGLLASRSESSQTAVYLASEPALALGTAERHAIGNITLVAVLVSDYTELHPDEDIFLYRESLDGIDVDKLFRSKDGNVPASVLIQLDLDDDPTYLADILLINNSVLSNSRGVSSNAAFYGSIGFDGDPAIVEVAEYILEHGIWTANVPTEYLPSKIKR